jgi:hypothetical protein
MKSLIEIARQLSGFANATYQGVGQPGLRPYRSKPNEASHHSGDMHPE